MEEDIDHIIKFSKYAKENLIPLTNGYVSKDFIHFVYQTDLSTFIEHFQLDMFFPEQYTDEAFMSEIRKDATVAVVSQIADINNDFFNYSIIGNNNIINLRGIIEGLGFKLALSTSFELTEELNEENFQAITKSGLHSYSSFEKLDNNKYKETSKENILYFHNEQTGFLWVVETRRNYFVFSSTLYGNIRKNKSTLDLRERFTDHSSLNCSDVFGFSMNMSELPVHCYDSIIMNAESVPEWLIVPTLGFDDVYNSNLGLFHHLNDLDESVRYAMFGEIIENWNIKRINKSNCHSISKELLSEDREMLKKELFTVAFLFNAWKNPSIFYEYFEAKGFNMTKKEINHFIYEFFSVETMMFKKLKSSEIVNVIDYFKPQTLKLIKTKDEQRLYKIDESIEAYLHIKSGGAILH